MEIKQINFTTTEDANRRVSRISIPKIEFSFIKNAVKKIINLISKPLSLVNRKPKNSPFNSSSFLAKKKQRKSFNQERNSRFKNIFKTPQLKSFIKPALATIAAIALIIGGQKALNGIDFSSNESDIEIKGAKASKVINRVFNFPLNDENNERVSDIIYEIEKAELRDEIVVKGQRATSIKGRTFLILTLKIKNEYRSDIEINTRDYIRLSVNRNKDEWLAPDIHNDPAEVQAISTKYTRVGFPINDSDTDLVLRVGEIDGEKQEFPIDF